MNVAKSDLMLCETSVVKRATVFKNKKKRKERGSKAYEDGLPAAERVIDN